MRKDFGPDRRCVARLPVLTASSIALVRQHLELVVRCIAQSVFKLSDLPLGGVRKVDPDGLGAQEDALHGLVCCG